MSDAAERALSVGTPTQSYDGVQALAEQLRESCFGCIDTAEPDPPNDHYAEGPPTCGAESGRFCWRCQTVQRAAKELERLRETVKAVREWAVQLQANRKHENEFMVMAAVEVDQLLDKVLNGEDE